MGQGPKRRKSKDNPYTLEYSEVDNKYYVIFKDGIGMLNKIEVDFEVYKEFDRFELKDLKGLNEYDRHIEHSEVYETKLYNCIMDKPLSLDDIVESNLIKEKLKLVIDTLPDIQKRRIVMYFYEDMTYDEIAKIEDCSKVAVKYSIDNALIKLKKFLKI